MFADIFAAFTKIIRGDSYYIKFRRWGWHSDMWVSFNNVDLAFGLAELPTKSIPVPKGVNTHFTDCELKSVKPSSNSLKRM